LKENTISKLTHKEKEPGGVVHLVRKYTPHFFLHSQSRYSMIFVALMIDLTVILVLNKTFPYVFFQDGGNWVNSHVPSFSAMDPTYSLPENVALLTLQVCPFYGEWTIVVISLIRCF
jgi:hypothetical protein